MLRTESGRSPPSHGRLYRVCWESSVTRARGRSAPMSRDQAEFLARDEAIGTAFCRFWVEPMDMDDARDGGSGSRSAAACIAGARRVRPEDGTAHGTERR